MERDAVTSKPTFTGPNGFNPETDSDQKFQFVEVTLDHVRIIGAFAGFAAVTIGLAWWFNSGIQNEQDKREDPPNKE